MKLKKWICLLLAAMLLVAFAGCGHIYTKAMTVDGEEISAGTYLMLQLTAYSEAKGLVADTEQDVLKQKVEEQDATQWINNRTEELCRDFVAVKKLAAEKEVALSEESSTYIDQYIDQYWPTMESYYAENGVGKDTFRSVLENDELRAALFEAEYAEGSEKAPSKEEITTYYGDANAHIRAMVIYITDETGAAISNLSDVQGVAQEMLTSLRAGEDMTAVATEQMPVVHELLGTEDYDASTAASEVSSYYIAYEDESATFTEEFLTRLKGEKVGTFGSFENDTMILVYEKIDTFETDDEYTQMRSTIIQEMKQDEFDEYLKGVADGYTVSKDSGAINYLSPNKIVV